VSRVPIPSGARILVELGATAPTETTYDAFRPFELAWIITNGSIQRVFLWVTLRRTGIYVAFGGPGNVHTSYHTDGRFHWKIGKVTQELGRKPRLPNIPRPVLIQNATTAITNDALDRFELADFGHRPVDRVIFMDNRMLPDALHYDVWVVPPFRHGDVPLNTEWPAHIHIATHTNPWIELVVYEQGPRVESSRRSG